MSRRNKENGLWFSDNYLEYIKGYSPLHKAVQDGLEGLRKEISTIKNSMFPMVDVPVASRPGYVTHEHNYFHVKFLHDSVLKDLLEKYFFSKYSRSSGDLYGVFRNFAGLLTETIHDLFLYGRAYYLIEWGEVEIGGNNYTLPISFDRLDTLTTRRNIFGNYIQKYSLYTYFFGSHFKTTFKTEKKLKKSYKFTKSEILTFHYPFGRNAPVKQTYKYVSKLRTFWQFGIDQQRTTLEPNNHTFPLEYARHTTFNNVKRQHALLKSKVKNIFHNVIGTGVNITYFYDVYIVTRHKKKLNELRHYLVQEFNKQVIARIADKNGWSGTPEIYFDHFLTNKELESYFQDFADRKITIKEYIKKVINKN